MLPLSDSLWFWDTRRSVERVGGTLGRMGPRAKRIGTGVLAVAMLLSVVAVVAPGLLVAVVVLLITIASVSIGSAIWRAAGMRGGRWWR